MLKDIGLYTRLLLILVAHVLVSGFMIVWITNHIFAPSILQTVFGVDGMTFSKAIDLQLLLAIFVLLGKQFSNLSKT